MEAFEKSDKELLKRYEPAHQKQTIITPEPITPPEPIIPLQPVIAPQLVITPEQLVEPPPSIKKEKKNIVTSDTILDPATSADLCKLQIPRPSTGFAPAPALAPAPKSSFSANLMHQQVTFAPSPAYISHAEEMEATGQG